MLVGEYFHTENLAIRSNADNRVGFTADNTGNVHAVCVIRRSGVRISVRIVKRERKFRTVIYVVDVQTCVNIGRIQFAFVYVSDNVVSRHSESFARHIDIKSLVCILDTGIQYCDDHAFAVIAAFTAVENTGVVYADFVYNRLGGHIVNFGHDNVFNRGIGFYLRDVAVSHLCGKTVEHRRITVLVLNFDTFSGKRSYKSVLLHQHRCGILQRTVGKNVVRDGIKTCGFAVAVLRNKRLALKLDNNPQFLIRVKARNIRLVIHLCGSRKYAFGKQTFVKSPGVLPCHIGKR